MTDVTPWVNDDKGCVFPRVFKSWSPLLGRLFFFCWNNAAVCVDPGRFNVVATKDKTEWEAGGRRKEKRRLG